MEEFTLTSSAFNDGDTIPSLYTCDGKNVSPPLSVRGVPNTAKSLVLIVDDADIPEAVKKARLIDKFDHWILFNIEPADFDLKEGESKGVHGKNTRGNDEYTGPCPPPEHEPTTHRYVFQLYALDCTLELPEGTSEPEVRQAMKGHIIDRVELMGIYDRSK